MNKFVLGALALAASSTPCLAGSDNEWASFDSDLANLAQAAQTGPAGASVSGFLRASYANSGDVQAGGNDLGGFSIDQARLNFSGSVGNYNVFMSVEATPMDDDQGIWGEVGNAGALGMLDAYASFPITDAIRGQIGAFRAPFLRSSLTEEDTLLFIDRSSLAHEFDFRDNGLMVSGNFDKLVWQIAAMNGDDGAGNDLLFSGRVAFTLMGNSSAQEGAYGATDQNSLTIGAGYIDDSGTIDNNTAMCLDANFSMGQLSASAEMVDFDKGTSGIYLPGGNATDNTPWNAAVSFMLSPDQWEAAVRYQDYDDDDSTTAITAGLNWYQNGHAAKWQFNWSTTSSDNAANEMDVIQIGLTASI